MKNSQTPTMQTRTVKTIALLITLCCALLTLDSCKKDTISDTTTDANSTATTYSATNTDAAKATTADDFEILERLLDAGYHADDLEFLEDFVVYQGDAGWDKTALLATLRSMPTTPADANNTSTPSVQATPETASTDRQQGILEANYLDAVTATKIKVLKYYIRPSIQSHCGSAWVTAINSGMSKWNAAANCRVKLAKVTSQASADIVWGSDIDTGMPSSHQNLPVDVIARAGFPSGGTPWQWISVNDNMDDWGSKLKTAMHEFGHCVGYRHTGTSDGFHIHGTPTSETGSIMNQGSNTSPAFTSGDLRAMRMYYPDALAKATNLTAVKYNSTTIKVTYKNPSYVPKPYYWIKTKLFSAGGSLLNSGFLQADATTDGVDVFYWINLTPGTTYKVSVFGENFRHDVAGVETAAVTVSL